MATREALELWVDGSAGFRLCHSSPEKVGCKPMDSGPWRELEETGAVRVQETLSSTLQLGLMG